jgi:hypothetical protein
MNAAVVVRSARADGLSLTVSEAGAVELSGSRSAVDRWAPAIASNKPDIVAMLRQEAAQGCRRHRRPAGPNGSEDQRLAAEGAKTAKAILDSALAAGHESLSKITNMPPAHGQSPKSPAPRPSGQITCQPSSRG